MHSRQVDPTNTDSDLIPGEVDGIPIASNDINRQLAANSKSENNFYFHQLFKHK